MKSNVCKIDKGTKDLEAIFTECEKVAAYNSLSHKQALQLRLLCEEIDGMLPHIIDEFDGDFWIEFEDGVCKIKASIKIPELTADKKDELIAVAKNKKNAAAVGVVGKIRDAVENFLLSEETTLSLTASSASVRLATGFSDGVDYAYLWSLEQYRNSVKEAEEAEAWDELEKSVIASAADDVTVGVKGNKAEIVIVKKFA